ncbi:MAG: hypothetical protein RLY97_2012, partial [Pseudomonadota bacterium]
MNFDLTEDELMLQAVAERFVTDRYDIIRQRVYQAARQGFSAENWVLLAEIGILAAPFALEHGGLGASQTDIALIAEALGTGLAVEPWIDSVLVAGQLLAESATPAVLSAWIDGLMNGQKRLALAYREAGACGNDALIETRAEPVADGWQING